MGEEYRREEEGRLESPDQRRAERVRRLLAGEPLDASELNYELTGWHLGVAAAGRNITPLLADVAKALDRRLLSVLQRGGIVWAWLAGRRPLDPTDLENLLAVRSTDGQALAIGQPGEGVAGWRLTHQQAKAALPVALRGGERTVRYAEVALLSSVSGDDLLVTSLRKIYLEPLERERDGGDLARETLRAYFAAERSISSAAAKLGVSRQAVGARLRTIEACLGQTLEACALELNLILQLQATE